MNFSLKVSFALKFQGITEEYNTISKIADVWNFWDPLFGLDVLSRVATAGCRKPSESLDKEEMMMLERSWHGVADLISNKKADSKKTTNLLATK